LNNYMETAQKAALAASEIQHRYWMEGFEISSKSNIHDRVTSADKDSEKAIIDIIAKTFPDHSFLGEESDSTEGTTGYL